MLVRVSGSGGGVGGGDYNDLVFFPKLFSIF
jgi:hypothetical protein